MATLSVLNPGSSGIQTWLEPSSGSTPDDSVEYSSPIAEGIRVSLSGAGLTKGAGSHGR